MKTGRFQIEIKERTYDLKSKGQGRMIQVSIPASVPLKEFDYNARVESHCGHRCYCHLSRSRC